jgi:predicted transcriptional regulator
MKESILISIHPEYVEKIFSGKKRFEFRRKIPSGQLRRVVIYATAPVKSVVAVVEVKSIFSDSPERLWFLTRRSAGISKKIFKQYFAGRGIAHAIELGNLRVLDNPKTLTAICPSIVAPQSYRFVDESFFDKL